MHLAIVLHIVPCKPCFFRVLPAADELPQVDPWEEGFDTPGAIDDGNEPALAEDEAPPGFRRR